MQIENFKILFLKSEIIVSGSTQLEFFEEDFIEIKIIFCEIMVNGGMQLEFWMAFL